MQDVTAAHKEWMGWGLCPEPGSFACYDEPSLNWGYLVMVKGSWGDTFQASTHGGHWDFGEGCMGCVPSPVLHLKIFTRRTRSITALGRAGGGGEKCREEPPVRQPAGFARAALGALRRAGRRGGSGEGGGGGQGGAPLSPPPPPPPRGPGIGGRRTRSVTARPCPQRGAVRGAERRRPWAPRRLPPCCCRCSPRCSAPPRTVSETPPPDTHTSTPQPGDPPSSFRLPPATLSPPNFANLRSPTRRCPPASKSPFCPPAPGSSNSSSPPLPTPVPRWRGGAQSFAAPLAQRRPR